MKNINDIIKLKESLCTMGKVPSICSCDNKYQDYIETLFDYYISKFDGITRIKCELNKWDEESKRIIIIDLINTINDNYVMDFNAQEFVQQITE